MQESRKKLIMMHLMDSMANMVKHQEVINTVVVVIERITTVHMARSNNLKEAILMTELHMVERRHLRP